MAKEKKLPSVKGVPYEIVGETVVVHKEDGDVALPLVLGKSAYSIVFSFLNKKGERKRNTNGSHKLGNFGYAVEGNELTITRKDGSVLAKAELKDGERYPRTVAVNLILSTLE